jgi:hypothetical protein
MRFPSRSDERPARLLRTLPLAAGAALLAACADGTPVELAPNLVEPPETTLAAFDCVVTVGAGMTCRSPAASAGDARGMMMGGQDTYLRLSSSNVSYDSGTEIFQMDVTVQNLLNEAIGTPDGTVPDPEGIQVFFADGPNVSGGTGEVTVANADGTAFFLAANQPYFAYPEVLAKDEVSAPKTWQFSVPGTVTSFGFRVYVETEIQYLLVINELLANPGGTISDANGEWFELYNAGTMSVDLQNLVIADSAASGRRPYHLISSSVVVASGGYVVLGNTTNTTNNGGVPVDYA